MIKIYPTPPKNKYFDRFIKYHDTKYMFILPTWKEWQSFVTYLELLQLTPDIFEGTHGIGDLKNFPHDPQYFMLKDWPIYKALLEYNNLYNNDNHIRCEGAGSSNSSVPE